MPDTAVSQPILNPPHAEPTRHWALGADNIATDALREGRRPSSDRLAIPGADNPAEAREPFGTINQIRREVAAWRAAGWPGAGQRTRRLLDFWNSGEAEPRPFFAQREAVETAIWLHEAGPQLDKRNKLEWRDVDLKLGRANAEWNDGVPRIALKMATGAGKTMVMAMLMVWHAVNRGMPRDFLIVAPNLTVMERLQELKPNDSAGRLRGLTPRQYQAALGRLRVSILNFQKFQHQNRLWVDGQGDVPSGTIKKLLATDPEIVSKWEETDEAMLDRLLKSHRAAERIVVINDEAHHCYRPPEAGRTSREEKDDEQMASLWFSAVKAIHAEGRLEQVYDLSATPMYLRKPGALNSPIFPWTVSDYPLSDAIEAGLTKIPRVPVRDDSSDPEDPVYRNVYRRSEKRLDGGNMQDPARSLLDEMHAHYRERVEPAYRGSGIVPAMIVVANTIANAEQLYRWIAGYQDAEGRWIAGHLPLFSNVRQDGGGYVAHPPTLVVHSKITDGGADALTGQARTITEEQARLHAPEAKTLEERRRDLRDVFMTVGRAGQAGEGIRCVISVGMLSEGWDAKTVTHIFGFRAFGSALLCEQVTGRALRRMSYEPDPQTNLPRPEYANVFGVPYEFMRAQDSSAPLPEPRPTYVVEPLPQRRALRVHFPNVAGYCWSEPPPRCHVDPEVIEPYEVTASAQPTQTTILPSVGQPDMIYNRRRAQEAIFLTAAAALEQFAEGDKRRRALFGDMVGAVEQWLAHPKVACDDPVRLLHDPHKNAVPMVIADACVSSGPHPAVRLPIFADVRDPSQARVLDTGIEGFETSVDPKHETERSELNIAPCDSELEKKTAEALDAHPRIEAWARNFRLDWQIPWFDKERGLWREYRPDFVARVAGDGLEGSGPERHLIIECKGRIYEGAEAEAKRKAVEEMWIPAVANADGAYGEWGYVYITEDDDPAAAISAAIAAFGPGLEAGAGDG